MDNRSAASNCNWSLIILSIFLIATTFVSFPIVAQEAQESHRHPVYTCTMHPQVRSDKPGKCPICGMTLVPVQEEESSAEEEIPENGPALDHFEQMALSQNPTIAQAIAAVQAAEGRKSQAMLYPNPVVGVQVDELSQRDPLGRNSEHVFFTIEQQIILGGKRGKAGELFTQEGAGARNGLELQKQAVLNAVRTAFYKVLGLQRELAARKKLQAISEEAAGITQELFNVGQADRPDVLEAEIEAQQAQLAVTMLEEDRQKAWKELAALVGNPDMPLADVSGMLETNEPELEYNTLLQTLLAQSVQMKAAQLQVQRSQAGLALAEARRVPDLTFRGGLGYNYEKLQMSNQSVGLEGFFEVGIPLPLFNRNQGQIAVANAEISRAQNELQRVRLSLTRDLAQIYSDYRKAGETARKYGNDMLPRARQAYELYLASFRQMAAAYPQVLIAQRNRYGLEVEYVKALTEMQVQAIRLKGFLLMQDGLEAPPPPYSTDGTSPGL